MHETLWKIKTFLRTSFWRLLFGSYGKGTKVFGRIVSVNPKNVFIGDNVTLNEGVILNAVEKITIGSGSRISSGVIINTTGLDFRNSMSHFSKPVIIGRRVWLCSGALINPGVVIGDNAVVGAGAVVTKDVEPNTVVVGVPAKPHA